MMTAVMQRIAVPMIGGLVSSTILTLVVIPAIYGVIKGWRVPVTPLHQAQGFIEEPGVCKSR
jgi:Cu(I)/Ag(I) efflux system membrane protein CusA/SilA